MAKRKSSAQKADIKIRLTEGLRSQIERAAAERGVSMNSEMIGRLEQSYASDSTIEAANNILIEAKRTRDEAFRAALREAGFRVLRERGVADDIIVQLSANMLLDEASGILRSGFVAPDDAKKSPIQILIENAVRDAMQPFLEGKK